MGSQIKARRRQPCALVAVADTAMQSSMRAARVQRETENKLNFEAATTADAEPCELLSKQSAQRRRAAREAFLTKRRAAVARLAISETYNSEPLTWKSVARAGYNLRCLRRTTRRLAMSETYNSEPLTWKSDARAGYDLRRAEEKVRAVTRTNRNNWRKKESTKGKRVEFDR